MTEFPFTQDPQIPLPASVVRFLIYKYGEIYIAILRTEKQVSPASVSDESEEFNVTNTKMYVKEKKVNRKTQKKDGCEIEIERVFEGK